MTWDLHSNDYIHLQVGFDSLFFARIDYQDRAKRKDQKSLEVVWRGSRSLGSSAQVKQHFGLFSVSTCIFIFYYSEVWFWMAFDHALIS